MLSLSCFCLSLTTTTPTTRSDYSTDHQPYFVTTPLDTNPVSSWLPSQIPNLYHHQNTSHRRERPPHLSQDTLFPQAKFIYVAAPPLFHCQQPSLGSPRKHKCGFGFGSGCGCNAMIGKFLKKLDMGAMEYIY